MVSLIQLEYIVALARYQSFSVAADKCFVTQPTLSMQIKKLENDLDTMLFDRTKKPVKPTRIGSILIEQAKVILAETEKIDELIQINKQTLTGDLRIGIIPSLAPYLLPRFIGKFAKKHSGIRIHVQELLTHEIMPAVDNDKIDVGILATPIPRTDFDIIPLFYEKINVYCSKDHDFARLEQVAISQMRDQKIWLLSNGNCFRNQAINLCELKADDAEQGFQYESASIATLIKLVDSEGGMTLIPELAADDLTPKKREGVKPFAQINPVREISLITGRRFVKQRMVEVLRDAILANVPEELHHSKRGDIVEWT